MQDFRVSARMTIPQVCDERCTTPAREGQFLKLPLAAAILEHCPLPGCENPPGTGKTGACCGGHASKIAGAARARVAAAMTEPKPTTKNQRLAEEQRRSDRHARLREGLQEREARVFAALRTRRELA